MWSEHLIKYHLFRLAKFKMLSDVLLGKNMNIVFLMKEADMWEIKRNTFTIQVLVNYFIFLILIIILYLPGINTSFVYFGCMDSVFPYHIEDVNLASINRHFCGAPKIWIGFSSRNYDPLVKYFKYKFSISFLFLVLLCFI